jgi:hypothetical protein
VPEKVPAVESDRPGGSEPELFDQEYGEVPPVADRVEAYAEPSAPLGREAV